MLNTPARTAASLLGLALLGLPAPAQSPTGQPTLYFTKPAASAPGSVPAALPHPTLFFNKEPSQAAAPGSSGVRRADFNGSVDGSLTPVQRTAMQVPIDLRTPGDEPSEYKIQLEPPGSDRLFRLESEDALKERMRQEARERAVLERIQFPDEPVLSKQRFVGRHFDQITKRVEPPYVCHRKLLFEEVNAERYGWDFGVLQPFLSATVFYYDVATAPYKLFTRPCQRFDCSAGKCLPGDPVPYLIFPTELSATGFTAELGAILGLVAMFP